MGGLCGAGVLYIVASGERGSALPEGSPPTATAALTRRIFASVRPRVRGRDDVHVSRDYPRRYTQARDTGFAGLAIGLGLTLIHLISIPVTNTSVNPARSTAVALFVGGWAIQQLWLFWIAPLIGAAIAGFVYKAILEGPVQEVPVTGRAAA